MLTRHVVMTVPNLRMAEVASEVVVTPWVVTSVILKVCLLTWL